MTREKLMVIKSVNL